MKLGKVYSVEYRNASPITAYSRNLKAVQAMGMAASAPDMADNSYQQQQITVSDNVEAVFLLE